MILLSNDNVIYIINDIIDIINDNMNVILK